jgi:hypothetical protein
MTQLVEGLAISFAENPKEILQFYCENSKSSGFFGRMLCIAVLNQALSSVKNDTDREMIAFELLKLILPRCQTKSEEKPGPELFKMSLDDMMKLLANCPTIVDQEPFEAKFCSFSLLALARETASLASKTSWIGYGKLCYYQLVVSSVLLYALKDSTEFHRRLVAELMHKQFDSNAPEVLLWICAEEAIPKPVKTSCMNICSSWVRHHPFDFQLLLPHVCIHLNSPFAPLRQASFQLFKEIQKHYLERDSAKLEVYGHENFYGQSSGKIRFLTTANAKKVTELLPVKQAEATADESHVLEAVSTFFGTKLSRKKSSVE